MSNVVVIGAGVAGLSSALALQEVGHSVVIVARDLPAPFSSIDPLTQINYTSPWSGAHNRVVPPTSPYLEEEHAFSLKTFSKMEEVFKTNPEAGITFMKGIEYLEAPGEEYLKISETGEELGLKEFRLLKGHELPEGVKWGCEYRTWCVNPMVYCCFLMRRFVYRGGKVVRKELRCVEEVFSLTYLVGGKKVNQVVNCSGIGFGDKDVFPTRGQTCLVANPCPVTVTRQCADGSWTFCVPRNFEGGTIVGGTKEPDNWDPSPSPTRRSQLLKAFAGTYPPILSKDSEGKDVEARYTVLADIVGRRPTRKGGIRLEREDLGEGRIVVHAYGLGGRGYELSWGVAERVAQLVGQ